MKVVFFCENANHVWISERIAKDFSSAAPVTFEVALLDWQKDTARWVIEAVKARQWNVPVVNIYDRARPMLRERFKSESNKSAFLKDMLFDYFVKEVTVRDRVLVQFNDRSVRGGAVAGVCRNIGLHRLLVQDGFLNFESKTGSLETSDRNFLWGTTAPELIAVWGEEMAKAVSERNAVDPGTVHVVGPTKIGFSVPERVNKKPARSEPLRVLWADQAIIDQNKAPRAAWLAEFAEIGEALSGFETDVRLHPSTRPSTVQSLQEALGDRYKLGVPDAPMISEADISEYDVVVTYYSTIFLDCIKHQKPCVLFKTRSLDIELPKIEHPLLSYCALASELPEAVRSAASLELTEAPTPPDIFRYASTDPAFERCAALLKELCDRIPQRQAHEGAASGAGARASMSMVVNTRRLFGRRLLVVGGNFGDRVGVAKPIKLVSERLRALNIEVQHHLATDGSRRGFIEKVEHCDILLINSFDVVRAMHGDMIRKALSVCERRSIPVLFYCHETQYVFDRLRSSQPARVENFVVNILPRVTALAVSDAQAEWLGELGAREVRTVYNSVGHIAPIPERARDHDKPIILMVGSQQPRKGLDLFSRVADAAGAAGLPWRFVWLGGVTKAANDSYRSDRVEWLGHVEPSEVREWIDRATVFFLSSVDDPMPLSVGEALSRGCPCLVYSGTGYADVIKAQGGGAVFATLDAGDVLEELKAIVEKPESFAPDVEVVKALVGEDAFFERMLSALGEALIARNPRTLAAALALADAEAAKQAGASVEGRPGAKGAGDPAKSGTAQQGRSGSWMAGLLRGFGSAVRRSGRAIGL